MKIQVNGKDIFELLPWEIKLLEDCLPTETLHDDCCRRLEWVLKHKIHQSFKRLEEKWMKIFREDPSLTNIPTDKASFVEMVVTHPKYENRSQIEKREAEVLKKQQDFLIMKATENNEGNRK